MLLYTFAMGPSPTRMPSAAKPYYAPIDGVRCLCVLLVIINHTRSRVAVSGIFDGYLGVDLFFIISGFLISTLLLREERLNGRIDLSAFYWRRFFRIIPIYSVVLLLYVVICQLPSFHSKWLQLKAGLPYFLLFMNEYVREPAPGNVFTHTWSLGIEEKFYLVWPVLFFVLVRKVQARRLMLASILLLLAIATSLTSSFFAVSYFGLFFGCVMAVLLNSELADRLTRWLRLVPWPVILLAIVAGFYLNHTHSSWGRVAFSSLGVLFLSYLIVKPSLLSRFFGAAPLVWVGRRSYGMYLVHVLCLNAFEGRIATDTPGGTWVVVALGFFSSLLVAALLHVLVEEPCRKYGKAFIERRRLAAADAAHLAA